MLDTPIRSEIPPQNNWVANTRPRQRGLEHFGFSFKATKKKKKKKKSRGRPNSHVGYLYTTLLNDRNIFVVYSHLIDQPDRISEHPRIVSSARYPVPWICFLVQIALLTNNSRKGREGSPGRFILNKYGCIGRGFTCYCK